MGRGGASVYASVDRPVCSKCWQLVWIGVVYGLWLMGVVRVYYITLNPVV